MLQVVRIFYAKLCLLMSAAHQYYLYHNRATLSSHSKAAAPFAHSIEMTCRLRVPAGRDCLCFEPIAATVNGMNVAQAGTYVKLQSIPPGGRMARELLGQTRRVLGRFYFFAGGATDGAEAAGFAGAAAGLAAGGATLTAATGLPLS